MYKNNNKVESKELKAVYMLYSFSGNLLNDYNINKIKNSDDLEEDKHIKYSRLYFDKKKDTIYNFTYLFKTLQQQNKDKNIFELFELLDNDIGKNKKYEIMCSIKKNQSIHNKDYEEHIFCIVDTPKEENFKYKIASMCPDEINCIFRSDPFKKYIIQERINKNNCHKYNSYFRLSKALFTNNFYTEIIQKISEIRGNTDNE